MGGRVFTSLGRGEGSVGRMGTQGMERVKDYIIGEGEGSVKRMWMPRMERVKEYIIGEGE